MGEGLGMLPGLGIATSSTRTDVWEGISTVLTCGARAVNAHP